MLIKVTEIDIQSGCLADSLKCPLARAISRVAGKRYQVGALNYWEDKFDSISRQLPDIALAFRQDFDSGSPVSPIEFELPL
jgi:hypothetical protein